MSGPGASAQSSFAATFPNYTSFRSAGTVRELDAQQVLRACHVGGMFDARLEINVYRLLDQLTQRHGPWIGAPIKLTEQAFELDSDSDVLQPATRAVFDRCETPAESRFLSIREGTFLERTQSGEVISQVPFEYVIPQELSFSAASALPVVKTSGGTYVGVELRDLPAVQSFTGSSSIAAVPSWRLPRSLKNVGELPAVYCCGNETGIWPNGVRYVGSWVVRTFPAPASRRRLFIRLLSKLMRVMSRRRHFTSSKAMTSAANSI